jgi:hypothetical protein
MKRPFLTVRWTNLVLANYRVPPELLLPHVPPGSELDTPNDEPGLHLLSLVAMRFAGTHVYGIRVPTAQRFPEVNLRIYVRRGPIRACVFLREFVSVPLVMLEARLFYHQPYFLASLSHDVQVQGEGISVHTQLQHRGRGVEIRLRKRSWLECQTAPRMIHRPPRAPTGAPRQICQNHRKEERMKRLLIVLLLLFPLLTLSACEPQVYSGKIILDGKHALTTVDGDMVILGGQVTLKEGSQVTGSV